MNCLNNLVGIWDGYSEREDKLYIDKLSGFEMSWIDSLAREHNTSGVELLESIRDHAGNLLKNEIGNYLNPRVEKASILSNEVAGVIQENRQVKTAESKYKGVQITLNNYPYLSIYVDKISLYAVSAVTTNILVYDTLTGTLLDTLPITTTANAVTTIDVGKTYKNKGQYLSLAFVIDASVTNVYYVSATNRSCNDCSPRFEKYGFYGSGRGIYFTGTPLANTVQGLGHTNGIIVNYSVICDDEYFICNMAGRFALAMYYRFGVQLMEEILFSDRLNSLTTINRDKVQALQEKCLAGYDEQMKMVVGNMKLPNNPCYSCTPLIKNNTRIP